MALSNFDVSFTKWEMGICKQTRNSCYTFGFDKVDDTSSNDNSPTWVSKEGRYGCVDTLGNYVMPLLYESEINFYNHQPAKVKKSGKWGFLNETGHVIIPFNYTSTRGFGWNESLAPVSIGNKYGYINKKVRLKFQLNMISLMNFIMVLHQSHWMGNLVLLIKQVA